MTRTMTATLAAALLAASLGAPLMAQSDRAADADLPQILRDLGLTDTRTRPDDGETDIVGRLPGGGWIKAEARGDRLFEVKSDGAALPASLVAAMIPETVRTDPRFADIARLTEIEIDDREIEIEGVTDDGMRVEMELDRNGRMKEYKLERDDRRSMNRDAARARLAELGYTDIGFVERGGRHVEAMALNPNGERVEVRLDDRGRVERERAWLR